MELIWLCDGPRRGEPRPQVQGQLRDVLDPRENTVRYKTVYSLCNLRCFTKQAVEN